MKIIDVTSEVFEWERPCIWNGGIFYGPGRLHKVTVKTDEGIEAVANHIIHDVLFDQPPKKMVTRVK